MKLFLIIKKERLLQLRPQWTKSLAASLVQRPRWLCPPQQKLRADFFFLRSFLNRIRASIQEPLWVRFSLFELEMENILHFSVLSSMKYVLNPYIIFVIMWISGGGDILKDFPMPSPSRPASVQKQVDKERKAKQEQKGILMTCFIIMYVTLYCWALI